MSVTQKESTSPVSDGTAAPKPTFPATDEVVFLSTADHPFAGPCPRWCELHDSAEAPHLASETAHESPTSTMRLNRSLYEEGEMMQGRSVDVRLTKRFGIRGAAVALETKDWDPGKALLSIAEARRLAHMLTQFCDIAEDLDYSEV